MEEFEYIQKAIEILYIQDDLLAVISLTKFRGEEDIYNKTKENLKEFTEALKEKDDIIIGQGSSTVTLAQIIRALEDPNKKNRALAIIQAHHEIIVEEIYRKYCLAKQKNSSLTSMENSIKNINIFHLARNLILSFYGSDVLANLATSLHEIAKDEDYGYTFAFECLNTSENAPFYIFDLLMPTEVTTTVAGNQGTFLDKIERDYSNFSKKIPKGLPQITLESNFHYQMLYYILCYFKDNLSYKFVYDKIKESNKAPEIYYIIDKDIYKKLPKKLENGNISSKLNSVLANAESIQNKTNSYFKEIEKIKNKALRLKEQKKNKVNVSLKQSIILMTLSLTVAMLQELSERLSKLAPTVAKTPKIPKRHEVNADKLPRFIKWKEALDKFIESLDNKTDNFLYLIYYKLMSAILSEYDETSKIYNDIFTNTPFDDTNIRTIVTEKSKLIVDIQKNPLMLMDSICSDQNLDIETQDVIANFFKDANSSIVPITQNCIEEFCCILPNTHMRQQYQEIAKRTNKHPLYPLITIYCEWYKLRAFINFFENFGNNLSSYYIGIESVKGDDFEILYRDFIYLNYLFSSIYDELDPSTQSMVLKFLSIFSIKPENPNHHIGFKRLAVIESLIFTSKKFDALELEKYFTTKKNVKISSKCILFIRSLTERKDGVSLIEINQDNHVLAYKKDNKTLFKLTLSHNEYNEIKEELQQLQELGDQTAVIALAAIIFMKKYFDSFLIDTDLPKVKFKGFYTNEIFAAFRQVKLKSDPVSSFIDLKENCIALENLMFDLSKYTRKSAKKKSPKAVENKKIRATNYILEKCDFYKRYFLESGSKLDRLELNVLEDFIMNIRKLLEDKDITKATIGESKCKANLKQAVTVFSELYYKLTHIDQCYFSQYTVTSLKPFKPNDMFTDNMAYYLSKTFVRNEESSLTRHQNLNPYNIPERFNKEESKTALEVANIETSLHKFNYENDQKMLGAFYDKEIKQEVIPHNIDNRFYVFLRILAEMSEYYMDAIINIFGESFDKKDPDRYEKFLDKLIIDFQLAINTDFKTTKLDKIIKEFKISMLELDIYVNFTLKTQKSKGFEHNNSLDLSKLETFISSSRSRLKIGSFDKIKFYSSSYKEFSLIDKFTRTTDELNKIYSFMKENKNFIIISYSDLLTIYELRNEEALTNYLNSPDTEEKHILNRILFDPSTTSYDLSSFKSSIDRYHEYLSNNIILPDYDVNSIVLPCGLLNYEYEQLITIICQDIIENRKNYKGVLNFKWWHLTLIGEVIDYLYTTSHLAKGIKEIQKILNDENEPDLQRKIDKIIEVADTRLKKNNKRRDDVRNVYEFLTRDLSNYISKQKQISKSKPAIKFDFLNKRSRSFHYKYDSSNLGHSPHRGNQRGPVIKEIDINHPQVKEISKNLAPLYLLDDEMRSSVALEIVSDVNSHDIERASLVSSGFIDVCIGKRHLSGQINLNPAEKFYIKPCRCVTKNELEGPIVPDILKLTRSLGAFSNNLILLPISFNNWHFILLIIDIKHRTLYFFDSYGDQRVNWAKDVIKDIPELRNYSLTTLTDNFQQNNDCGFLVLHFIDYIYMHNNLNMNMLQVYSAMKKNYDSNFLRQYFCSFAGEPFANSSDFLNFFESNQMYESNEKYAYPY
ncbi:hypothetical protein FRA_36c08600 [Francisella sp. W12-1067]|nr:hypothetical protein FRA_36c08600 [Francisella sp. W12-1067]